MKFDGYGVFKWMLPASMQMVSEFMDGGEPVQKREHYPINSYNARPPLTAEQREKINRNECPKCGGKLGWTPYYSGGQKCWGWHCSSCSKDWFEDEIPEPFVQLFPKGGRRPPVGKKSYREFTCAYCHAEAKGKFMKNQIYCSTKCYQDARRIANREAYRRKNTLTRDLGV